MAELVLSRLFVLATVTEGAGKSPGSSTTTTPTAVRTAGQRLTNSESIFAASQEWTRESLLASLQGRYNYASADCAARILTTNRGAKCPYAILQSQKDSYMLNLCSFDDKHVIIELCQDIRIDALVIANFEYFSSMVKDFRLSVSKKYPPPPSSGWKLVGTFVAENSKQEQPFLVVGTTMYSRYVRLDFDTHHGNEYYCLLSKVRIYGKTMMEDFEESSLHGLPTPAAKDIVIPIEAKVVPAPRPSEVSTRKSVTNMTDSRRPSPHSSTSDSVEGPVLPMSFNLKELFRQHKEFCQATIIPASSSSVGEESASDYDALQHNAHAFGDNIFKAIYDRLHLLERKASKGSRALEAQVRNLHSKLRLIEGELGFLDEHTGEFLPAGGRPSTRSYRHRLLRHVNERIDVYLRQANRDVQKALQSVQSTDRLLRWISVLALLQVLLIFGFISWKWTMRGWLRHRRQRDYVKLVESQGLGLGPGPGSLRASLSTTAAPRPITGALIRHHQRAVSSHLTSTTSTEDSDQQVPSDEYRGASPARSDLIDTAGKPLLLDESEPELIDATYIPSPLSASSSVASMDLNSSGQNTTIATSRPPSRLRQSETGHEYEEAVSKVPSSSSPSPASSPSLPPSKDQTAGSEDVTDNGEKKKIE